MNIEKSFYLFNQGSKIDTPVSSKCRVFRVTTVNPCSRAVAAIKRSTPEWPSSSLSLPQRRAMLVSIGRILSL